MRFVPPHTLQNAASVDSRRHPGPLLKRTEERTGLIKPHQQGHIGIGQFRTVEVVGGRFSTALILNLLIRGDLCLEPAPEAGVLSNTDNCVLRGVISDNYVLRGVIRKRPREVSYIFGGGGPTRALSSAPSVGRSGGTSCGRWAAARGRGWPHVVTSGHGVASSGHLQLGATPVPAQGSGGTCSETPTSAATSAAHTSHSV